MYDFIVLSAEAAADTVESKLGYRSLGAHKISWIARKHGYSSITIGKLHLLTEDQIVDLVSPFIGKNTIIGVSVTFMFPMINNIPKKNKIVVNHIQENTYKIVNAVEKLKKKYNNKVLLGGGTWATLFKSIFNTENCIPGLNGENEVIKFLDANLRHGIQKKPYDWNIQSCDFKWSRFDGIQKNEALPLEIARGCIFKCKFCAFGELGKERGTFERCLDLIKNELLYNYDNYGTTHYWFTSDTVNDDPYRMNQWCDMLATLPFKISYSGFFRLDLAVKNLEVTKRLRETGLKSCQFGIESFDKTAAASIGKFFNYKQGKEALDYLFYEVFNENLVISCSNIVGLPGETIETLKESFEYYKKRNHIYGLYMPLGLPGVNVSDKGKISGEIQEFLNNKENISEFASDPIKYGYRYPNNHYEWETDIMNRVTAANLATAINTELELDNRINSWSYIKYAAINNMEPKEMFAYGAKKINLELTKEINKLNQNYFDYIKNLGNEGIT